jgi:eukaryotic-like serine/threonine-protein kinase
MATQATCSQCGRPLPEGVPVAFCPVCTLCRALEEEREARVPKPEASDNGSPVILGIFGDYELLEEIARGGMGVVYRARQLSLNRIVALKLMLPFSRPELAARFRAEAETAASLQHPNIVAIHEVGEHAGHPYFSMDYVSGPSLAGVLRDGPLAAQPAAQLLRTIAEAVQYAHQHGVLHRDLKPSNVLIDELAQPRVTDFGLAKRFVAADVSPCRSLLAVAKESASTNVSGYTELTELTLSGQVLGSPNFMAPEQAEGRRVHVGPACDVYSLGAILYHTLSGRPPFQGETLTDVLHQVVNTAPVAPRQLNPSIPRDLETLCLKCLEKDPRQRFESAQALAEELGRFLAGEPILARPIGPIGKVWRWCRRNPALTLVTGVSLVSMVAGITGIIWQWRQAEWEHERAEIQRARAEAGEMSAWHNLYAAEMNLAQQALVENNFGRARELLDHYWPRTGEPDLRSWEWRYLWQQCQGDEQFTFVGHSNRVHALAFSTDGRWLASAAADDTVRLWDLPTRRQVAIVHCRSETYNAVLFSPDAQRLFSTVAGESAVRIWQVPSLEPLGELSLDGEASRLALSPDGRMLAAVGGRGVKLWSTTDGRELAVINPPANLFAGRMAFSPDGHWVAVNASDGRIFVWDWLTGSPIATLTGHTRPPPWGYSIFALGFAADGKTLVSAGADSTVRLWDVAAGREWKRLETRTSVVGAIAFSPDRKVMATASTDQTVELWDTSTWRALGALRGHLNEVWAVAFAPDGSTLATGGKDDMVKLWSTQLKSEPVNLRVLPDGLLSSHFSADARSVFLLRTNGAFTTLSLNSWRETEARPFPVLGLEIGAWAVASGGALLVVSDHGGRVRTWTLPDCRPGPDFIGATAESGSLVFSGDGRRMAAASADRTFRVWEVANRQQVAQFTNEVGGVKSLGLSAAGDLLGIGYNYGWVEVWDVRTRHKLAQLPAHKAGVQDMVFLSNPPQLVTASGDGTVKIWDLGTQRLVATLRGSLLGMNSLAVSPDKRRLAAGAGEGIIKVWDLASYREVATLKGHASSVNLAFSFDGNDLIAVSQRAVCVWHAPSFAEIGALEIARSETAQAR